MTSYDIISWGKNVVVFVRSQRKRQLNVTDGLLFYAILISHSSVESVLALSNDELSIKV